MRKPPTPALLPGLVLLAVSLSGCPTAEPDCVPIEDSFHQNVKPIITAVCADCHGATPEFGAPFSLLEYAPLIDGVEGHRIVDKMVVQLEADLMPPAGNPRPGHNDYDTLLGWASCGLSHPDNSDGLVASQPIWEAPENAPPGTMYLDLTAEGHLVELDDIDDYQYITFGDMVEGDLFVRRIEPIIDESRVVHHITVQLLNDYRYIYTWAPGTGAIQFPEGGLRIRPGDVYVIGIHYNNGAGIGDAYDSSGIRLWMGAVDGTEWTMASPVAWNISVPPGETAEATAVCTVGMDFEIIAGMPHMHEIGSSLSHTVRRADGTEESIIELTGWSFELQYFYEMSMHLEAGDELTLTCTFDNDKDYTVYGGQNTTDEMCFNFIYVTPPEAAFECSEF
jgi:hypothetical protein